jgi:hypothetical protein
MYLPGTGVVEVSVDPRRKSQWYVPAVQGVSLHGMCPPYHTKHTSPLPQLWYCEPLQPVTLFGLWRHLYICNP